VQGARSEHAGSVFDLELWHPPIANAVNDCTISQLCGGSSCKLAVKTQASGTGASGEAKSKSCCLDGETSIAGELLPRLLCLTVSMTGVRSLRLSATYPGHHSQCHNAGSAPCRQATLPQAPATAAREAAASRRNCGEGSSVTACNCLSHFMNAQGRSPTQALPSMSSSLTLVGEPPRLGGNHTCFGRHQPLLGGH
jgi:hypothetical protein